MKILKCLYFTCASLAAMIPPVHSQATLDRVLSGVSVSGTAKCSSIDVRLNRPVSYRHHFPKQAGRELDISIELLATEAGEALAGVEKEAASVSPGNAAGLDRVAFDPAGSGGATIQISFDHKVTYRVVMDSNTRHLRVDVANSENAKSCLGISGDLPDRNPSSDAASKTDGPPLGGDAASALKDGKAQLVAKNFSRATAFFTKAVEIGKGELKQEAQELLGVSREKAGQFAHAKAEYQTYLKSYPTGAGGARVRGRLDGLLVAMDGAAGEQFDALNANRSAASVADDFEPAKPSEGPLSAAPGKGDPLVAADPGVGSGVRLTNKGLVLDRTDTQADPNAWTWERNGSFAQYYYRNDNLRSSDPAKQNYGLHEVFQNEILTSADATLRGENQNNELELRTSLFNERGFGQQSDINATNIGTLYADWRMKDTGLSSRVGRQSKSTGGVFGRYDGALLGWKFDNEVKLQAYAGSPVYRRDAKPFADKRLFYGLSADYTFPGDQWAGALYAISQDVDTIVDRRALGAELRFNNQVLSLYGAGDYDVFYGELNNAYLNANWHMREGTNIYGTIDFRRVPFLVTSNSLMGQVEDDLQSLVDIFGEDSVYEFAVDRTATAKTASLGMSQEIVQDWQISIDGTIADYSGTPASGGVDAIPDPGVEYYASAQLSGADVFKTSDSLSLGLRYSGSDSSNFFMADAYYRFLINEDWRISPRLRLSMRDSKTSDQKQYVVSSSLASRYKINKNWSFETELGLRWEDIVTPMNDARSIDILATAGYRFEF